MAKIVLVHGAFNELWGPNELKARWLPALRDGLWHHDREVADEDVAVCFYGDLFRRTPGTDLDQAIAASRAGIAEALSEMADGVLLDTLSMAAGEAAFDRTVDMVTIMATEPDLRAQLSSRLEALVGDDTRVVVAHSLGSVLSYIALSNHPEWPVHTLVTLGSPLASPMVSEQFGSSFVEHFGGWPGSVQRWVNVRALNDKACAHALADTFGAEVEDILIDNGNRAHAPEPYLNAAATGAAIAGALN